MTNPFEIFKPQNQQAAAPAQPATGNVQTAPPMFGQPAAPAQPAPATNGFGAQPTFSDPPSTTPQAPANDPFADPSGPGSGERISDMVGCLLLCKPVDFIPQFGTANGPCDTIRADIAILDNTQNPGYVAEGILVFQSALVRDLNRVLKGPVPYLLGRLARGEARGNKSAPYIFAKASDEEKTLAGQFLTAMANAGRTF